MTHRRWSALPRCLALAAVVLLGCENSPPPVAGSAALASLDYDVPAGLTEVVPGLRPLASAVGPFTSTSPLSLLWCAEATLYLSTPTFAFPSSFETPTSLNLDNGCRALLPVDLDGDGLLEAVLASDGGVSIVDVDPVDGELRAHPVADGLVATALAGGDWGEGMRILAGDSGGALHSCAVSAVEQDESTAFGMECDQLLAGAGQAVDALAVREIESGSDDPEGVELPEVALARADGSLSYLSGDPHAEDAVWRDGSVGGRRVTALELGHWSGAAVIAIGTAAVAATGDDDDSSDDDDSADPGPSCSGDLSGGFDTPDVCADLRLLSPPVDSSVWGVVGPGDAARPFPGDERVNAIALADHDRDGETEGLLAMGPHDGGCSPATLSEGIVLPLPPSITTDNIPNRSGAAGVHWADVDGDGDLDVIAVQWECAGSEADEVVAVLGVLPAFDRSWHTPTIDDTADYLGAAPRAILGRGQTDAALWSLGDSEPGVARLCRSPAPPLGPTWADELECAELSVGQAHDLALAEDEGALFIAVAGQEGLVVARRREDGGVEAGAVSNIGAVKAVAWGHASVCVDGEPCRSELRLAAAIETPDDPLELGHVQLFAMAGLDLTAPPGEDTARRPLSAGPTDMVWLDADGADDLDLAVATHDGPLHVWTSAGGLLSADEYWRSAGEAAAHSLDAVDLDADGLPDLLLATGTLNGSQPDFVFQNLGDGFVLRQVFDRGDFDISASVVDADLDGRPEVVFGLSPFSHSDCPAVPPLPPPAPPLPPGPPCAVGALLGGGPLGPFDLQSAGDLMGPNVFPPNFNIPRSWTWRSREGRVEGVVAGSWGDPAVPNALIVTTTEPADVPGGEDHPTRLQLDVADEQPRGSELAYRLRTPDVLDANWCCGATGPGCETPDVEQMMDFVLTVFDEDGDPARGVRLQWADRGELWQDAQYVEGLSDSLPPGDGVTLTWNWEAEGAVGEDVRVRAVVPRQVPSTTANSPAYGARYSALLRLRLAQDADRDGIWDGWDACEHPDAQDCDADGIADCLEECDDPAQVPSPEGVACLDRIDNDCDGWTDGEDADCFGSDEFADLGCWADCSIASEGREGVLLFGLLALLPRRRRLSRLRGTR